MVQRSGYLPDSGYRDYVEIEFDQGLSNDHRNDM